jgi:flavodoxin/ferredoxin
MKCIVIYFSQTGNTEKVARVIQAGVKQSAGHCDIARIEDVNPRRLYEYDLIGLGSAVFGGQLGSVGVFLSNMRFVGGKHAFLFCTHGSFSAGGDFFPDAYKRMKRRGLIVVGMGDWYGDCYLLHMPQPYPTAGHPDEIDLKEAEDFGREMVLRSWRISAGETDLIPPQPPPLLLLPPLDQGEVPPDVMESFSSLLKFHKEKCLYPGCRLCMDNCPMDGIDLSVNPPVIAKPCLGCEWCTRICPTGALDMDEWVEAMASLTSKIMLSGVSGVLKNLEEAEAEGKFRRLVQGENPNEYYTNLDNYGYKKHKKHPQWIIGQGGQQ